MLLFFLGRKMIGEIPTDKQEQKSAKKSSNKLSTKSIFSLKKKNRWDAFSWSFSYGSSWWRFCCAPLLRRAGRCLRRQIQSGHSILSGCSRPPALLCVQRRSCPSEAPLCPRICGSYDGHPPIRGESGCEPEWCRRIFRSGWIRLRVHRLVLFRTGQIPPS